MQHETALLVAVGVEERQEVVLRRVDHRVCAYGFGVGEHRGPTAGHLTAKGAIPVSMPRPERGEIGGESL